MIGLLHCLMNKQKQKQKSIAVCLNGKYLANGNLAMSEPNCLVH